ncbi:MAG: cytochrome-c peroxidase [Myxococcaceae bacterium]
MIAFVSALVICASPAAAQSSEPAPATLASFAPLPAHYDIPANAPSDAKIALGRMLFFEKRLSKNHDVSCNSCHDLAKFGVDGKPFSPGHKKQLGGRNSPTVYNAGNHVAQFWDGRAATLEDQAKGPINNPVEMAAVSEAAVIDTLKSIPGYVAAFKKAFPDAADPVTFDNVAKAIGAFERRLVTPSRFDKYLAGDKQALTAAEKEGLTKFAATGCTACHMGAGMGGSMFQKLGLVEPWPDSKDAGRFDVTKVESDRGMFRVPSLRNIEKTAPYFHNGQVTKLDEAVKWMARHQLGKKLTDEEAASIVTFLKSLTGTLPKAYIRPPKLPPSGKTTPKPDPT